MPRQSTFDDLEEQRRQITRVRGRIGSTVLEFLRGVRVGGEFHASDLHEYVRAKCGGAPASADRILRDLRANGDCDYTVERSKSLYLLTMLRSAA